MQARPLNPGGDEAQEVLVAHWLRLFAPSRRASEKRPDLVFAIVYQFRTEPNYRKAKELIDSGVIGKLLMSRACLHEHWYNYQNHVAKTDFRLACDHASS